jgi:putative ABC transport system permease protein
MRIFSEVRAVIAALFRRRGMDDAMDDEFALHLELRTNDLVRSGIPRDAAERQARLEFGNVTAAKENARRSWGTAWWDRLEQDLRFTLRTLRKSPGFTAVAVLSLGFGIGATTTVFSVIDALDVRPLPYENADRLVWLTEVTPPDDEMCSRCVFLTASATAADWVAQTRSYETMAVVFSTTFSWERGDLIRSATAGQATPGFFRLLGVRPLLGREFVPSDTMPGAEPAVLLTYEFWKTRLDADSSIVGRHLVSQYDGGIWPELHPTRVIGVLPKEFRFMSYASVWVPMKINAASSRTARGMTVIGRMKRGQTIAAANAELATIATRLAFAYPLAYRGWAAAVLPLRDWLTWGRAGQGRFVLFAITLLVLCVAVANVAGLLLSRAAARQQEFAMRTALGASRLRLLGQQLVEGGCVGLTGGLIGIVVAAWGVRFTARWFSIEAAGVTVGIDHRILLFALAVSLVVGVGAAAVPALHAGRMDLSGSLRGRTAAGGSGYGARTSNALIALQVGLGLVLLTSAGLLSADFLQLRYLDLGYDPHGLYHVSITGTREQWANPGPWSRLVEDARQRVAAIPGIASTSLEYQNAVHPAIIRADQPVRLRNSQEPQLNPAFKAVGSDYFATWGSRLLFGRPFTTADRHGEMPVAIVNRAAAASFWPGQNPLGRRIFVGDSASAGELLTVVGVATDAERGEMAERHWPMVYRPYDQAKFYHAAARLYIRVAASSPELFATAQAAIRQATDRPVDPFISDEEQLGTRLLTRRFNAIVLDLFAGFGLLLAAMGIYGSIAYAVTQRTREIGVRVALGAQRMSILGLVARRGVVLAMIGVAAGSAGAFALTRVLRSFVSGTSVTNPWVFAGSSALMIVVALLATFLPARRATRLDAVIALRAE